MGGIHGSFLPLESLAEGPFDAVVIGEGEDRILPLSTLIAEGRKDYLTLPQVAARDDQDVPRLNIAPVQPVDMLRLPFPDWRSVSLDDYQSQTWQLVKRGRRVSPILTNCGCPYQCSFCANPSYHGRRLRPRDPSLVVDEMEWLAKEFGVDEIQIADDNFNANMGHAKAVLNEMIRRQLKLVWKPPQGIPAGEFRRRVPGSGHSLQRLPSRFRY